MIKGIRKDPISGAELIAVERRRQIEVEGYDSEHDDIENNNCELAMAAACYAAPSLIYEKEEYAVGLAFTDPWPWTVRHGDARPYVGHGNVLADPGLLSRKKRIALLVKAGALVAAEIDRLLRLGTRV